MAKAFGVPGCPSTVVIDRNGRMVGRANGEADWSGAPARRFVKAVLGERKEAASAGASRRRATKAVHLISAVSPGDPKLNGILDEAAAALKAGDRVEILFDAQSVGALRMNEGKTPLEESRFGDRQRRAISALLGIPQAQSPRNQLEYIEALKKAGASVSVNRNAIGAFGLTDAEIHPVAARVGVEQMEKAVEDSDACLNYNRE